MIPLSGLEINGNSDSKCYWVWGICYLPRQLVAKVCYWPIFGDHYYRSYPIGFFMANAKTDNHELKYHYILSLNVSV